MLNLLIYFIARQIICRKCIKCLMIQYLLAVELVTMLCVLTIVTVAKACMCIALRTNQYRHENKSVSVRDGIKDMEAIGSEWS